LWTSTFPPLSGGVGVRVSQLRVSITLR